MEQIVYLKWNSIEQPAKRVFLILLCCLQHPSGVWIKSCVMIGYHVGGRWTHLACTGLPALIPGKGGKKKKKRFIIFGLCHWWSHKKWQKTVLSKKDFHRFNVLQHNWLSIPVLKIHESFLILNKVRWFCYINPTKLVQLRWLDISLVLYLGFYWPRLQLGP